VLILIGNFVSLCVCHVRHPLQGGAQIVRRQVRVLARDCRAFVPHDIYSRKRRRAKGSTSVKRFLSQFSARKAVSVMRVRYALRCDWELLGAKTSPQDSNADTKKLTWKLRSHGPVNP
jgi:hypothetical protein